MTDDEEPSDSSRVSFGSRQSPHARSRLSQSQSATRASPLVSFSKSLQDARKNADALVISAQNNEHVKKFKDNLEDFEHKLKLQAQEATAKLNSMKKPGTSQNGIVMQDWHFPGASGARRPPVMRKSYSATDFSKFSQLLQPDSKERQLVAAEAGKQLEKIAHDLTEGPRSTLKSCQSTLGNCQENFQVLQTVIQHNLQPSLPLLKTKAELSAPMGGHNTVFKASGRVQAPAASTSHQLVATERITPEEMALDPWNILPGFLRAQELAAIEKAVNSGSPRHSGSHMQSERRRRKNKRKKDSTLRDPDRSVAIVTTAALPWMTGTSVNPLLRAAYLSRNPAESGEEAVAPRPKVTLMIPWLAKSDQKAVFPKGVIFNSPEEQEEYVRKWAEKRTGFESNFKVTFYPGRYAPEKGSILPVGDPTAYISDSEADVAVLEEPEHLNWYHHGQRWTDKFDHVVGIIHTNYLDYARREEQGDMKEKFLKALNSWVCRIHCHKVVKLSDAVQPLPRQTTQFIHGVPQQFLAVGDKKSEPAVEGQKRFSRGAYFMGKAVWAKGYTELLSLLESHRSAGKPEHAIDCYGNGEDLAAVKAASKRKDLKLKFHGAVDHLDDSMHEYKVFINPSKSDVVATTTAEALAMGKWVLVQDHPSNAFFKSFPNCLVYKDSEEFSRKLEHALERDPKPMTAELQRRLTWEDATERFLDVAELKASDRPGALETAVDKLAWVAHNTLTGIEPLRAVLGAGANTLVTPPNLADWEPGYQKPTWYDKKMSVEDVVDAASQTTEVK
ncbi:hypothetical protein ABBQ38_003008 [Trebouxia sp. C0009 RCD-2024]